VAPDEPSVALDEPPAATSLVRLSDVHVDPDVLLTSIVDHLERRLIELLDPASRTIRPGSRSAQTDEYRRRCVTLGRRVRVDEVSGSFTGVAVGLTDEGHLIVEDGSVRRVVMAGDVVHLRHQDAPGA
jgi:BirA family biotin operon repressor/biotin-[acetyl-CoA-carboxylase] ligase